MAITVESSPSTVTPAVRQVLYEFSSNAANLVHLKIRPSLDGSNWPTRDIDQEFGGTNFQVNVSNAIQDAFAAKAKANSYNLRTLNAGTHSVMNGMSVSVALDVFEVTGTSSPYTSNYPATPDHTTTTIYALNAARQHTESQSVTSYIADTSASKFLTNAPLTKYIRDDESEFLYIFQTDIAKVNKLQVITYDASGNTIATKDYSTGIVTANKVISVPVGTANLNTLQQSVDATDVITSTVASYTVKLTTSGGTATTETRTYKVDRSVLYPGSKRLHFWNTLGAVDAYTFTGNYEKILNTDYTRYTKFLDYDYAVSDSGSKTISTNAKYSHILSSNFESREVVEWLNEIKLSPYVFVESGSNYVPIQLNNGESIIEDDDLPRIKFEYSEANDVLTLRG